MHATELSAYIGRRGLLRIDRIRVPVTIVDAKRAYGNLRYQVSPAYPDNWPSLFSGATELGKDWVDAGRVQLED